MRTHHEKGTQVSLPTADGQHQSLSDRYGAPPAYRRVVTVTLLCLLVAASLGWLLWAALGQASVRSRASVRSYDVVSPHEVKVRFAVHRLDDAALVCLISAQAADHSIVGEKSVRVPPGAEGVITVAASVTTDRQATTAVVSGCS